MFRGLSVSLSTRDETASRVTRNWTPGGRGRWSRFIVTVPASMIAPASTTAPAASGGAALLGVFFLQLATRSKKRAGARHLMLGDISRRLERWNETLTSDAIRVTTLTNWTTRESRRRFGA